MPLSCRLAHDATWSILYAMADLITKLLPILHVKDPSRERDFYEQLGLHTTYEGSEYPDFIAVGNDDVEFGLSRDSEADPTSACITWQLGVSDLDATITRCQRAAFEFEIISEQPRKDWTYRVVKVRSPNGFDVRLEEQNQ